MENRRHSVELAQIFAAHHQEYIKDHKLHPVQSKAYRAIMACRSSALGGHQSRCDGCGHTRQAYNSCRNRHCPKCQFVKRAQWVDKLAANLPAVRYFHLVFTLPSCLHGLFYSNQAVAYSLFFAAAGRALRQCTRNASYLGAQSGAVAILHTWGQTLTYHPHIHMIVPAGGLSEDRSEWIPSAKNFLVPVKVLSAVFRRMLCALMDEALASGRLILPDGCAPFVRIKAQCYAKPWVVYCQKPFSTANSLIKYLGNYTHRVAISNDRLVAHEHGKVSFTYKQYKNNGARRVLTLDAHEFIRRFLQHILPTGFSKIRYFGFMALSVMKTNLAQCYILIGQPGCFPELEGLTGQEVFRMVTGIDPLRCTSCKTGIMRPFEIRANDTG